MSGLRIVARGESAKAESLNRTRDQRHLCPQAKQAALWTQIVSPHPGQVHLDHSLAMKVRIPSV